MFKSRTIKGVNCSSADTETSGGYCSTSRLQHPAIVADGTLSTVCTVLHFIAGLPRCCVAAGQGR